MRPVNKGTSPYTPIQEYRDALPYLESRIGIYCSYCGAIIDHAPEIEHVVSKSKGGDKTEWKNLLLACKYCNTRKSNKTIILIFRCCPWCTRYKLRYGGACVIALLIPPGRRRWCGSPFGTRRRSLSYSGLGCRRFRHGPHKQGHTAF